MSTFTLDSNTGYYTADVNIDSYSAAGDIVNFESVYALQAGVLTWQNTTSSGGGGTGPTGPTGPAGPAASGISTGKAIAMSIVFGG
jgi:hypothetical protein